MRLCLFLAATALYAQNSDVEHFEKKIRPVLAAKCFACHSSKLKSPMGSLVLDTRSGLRKGGASGPALIPGKPEGSRLYEALRFTNPQLQMPPGGKLADSVIADFEQWIRAGAIDPRPDDAPAAAAPLKGMDIATGRKWWAFQPVSPLPEPTVKNTAWSRTRIDRFILSELERARIAPSPPAERRVLIQRAFINLTGTKPTFEEIAAFVQDQSPGAYEALIERLLASPLYGERWGRYWLDVARYAEDNPTSEATNPPYPYAWRYRDWVIEAINRDVPYDRFVKLQLAADLMPQTPRADLRALGYLGAGPIYHKDARLSKDVIETLASDDWDERVDAVSRGLLGLTVACARCHDHKFDPITTKDYYNLASVFASSTPVERPLREIDPAVEKRFLWIQQRLFHLNYLAELMTGEPGTKPEEAKLKVIRFRAEADELRKETAAWQQDYPELTAYFNRPRQRRARGEAPAGTGPFMSAVFDAGLWIDGSDPDLTLMDVRTDTPRDLPVFVRGNPASPGEPSHRAFLSVLAQGGADFMQGSGRLELAERIFRDAAPLAARVMVNRVWAWHFGKPLVNTTSDFGTQGEKPSNPALLDDLSARFIASGWSLKWLHREIMLSSTYRQSSHPRKDAENADPTNRLLWRMNPRRLDVEAFRDSLLQVTGRLNLSMAGPSRDIDLPNNYRRTVYARVSRGRPSTLFRLYDFPDASQHSPGRDLTTTPLQQLFVMNSAFIQDISAHLACKAEGEIEPPAIVRFLYRRVLQRDPSPKELDLGVSYLATAPVPQYVQALLSTNEFIFWE